PAAGHEAVVVRAQRGTAGHRAQNDSEILRIDLAELQAGKLALNVPLVDGDTVTVPKAQSVFVTGQVKTPGAYAVDRETTVLHVLDYLRILYKRRFVALPVVVIVFTIGTFNSLRQTPVFRGRVQLLIEKDSPKVARLDQMFQSQDGWSNDDFYQTQFRILQSR